MRNLLTDKACEEIWASISVVVMLVLFSGMVAGVWFTLQMPKTAELSSTGFFVLFGLFITLFAVGTAKVIKVRDRLRAYSRGMTLDEYRRSQ